MKKFAFPFPKGTRVALVGMGQTNTALFDIFKNHSDVPLSLRDKNAERLQEFEKTSPSVRKYAGEGFLDALDEDVIFLSPTVRTDHPKIQCAIRRGASVTSDVSFFLEHTKGITLAITGSDGKSTTASLSHSVLTESGAHSRLGGNIGRAVIPFLFSEREGDCCVLELSSFQLQLPCFSPERGLITNLTPNHLDFHLSLEEYYEAKMRLLESARLPILNCDDNEIQGRTASLSPFVAYSMKERINRRAEHTYTVREDTLYVDGSPYLSLSPFYSRGATFVKNVVAALALTHGYHTPESAECAISAFRPLPHRRTLSAQVEGVSYYNCSADTTPSRTLETLSTFRVPLVLIMGGRSKGTDYGILCEEVKAHVRLVILCGENRAEIQDALAPSGIKCELVSTLRDAVGLARSVARCGDAVVFSPASTSFDCYKNFEERGEVFTSLI